MDIATGLRHGGRGRYRKRGRYLCNARASSSIGVEVAIGSAAAISKVAISKGHCIQRTHISFGIFLMIPLLCPTSPIFHYPTPPPSKFHLDCRVVKRIKPLPFPLLATLPHVQNENIIQSLAKSQGTKPLYRLSIICPLDWSIFYPD